jgi:hypothetical protein
MHGSQEIGTYLIYLFLFVIGVPANIMTVLTKSPLLLVLTTIMVLVNMLFCFGAAKIFKASLEDSIIASNANIGPLPAWRYPRAGRGWLAPQCWWACSAMLSATTPVRWSALSSAPHKFLTKPAVL